MTQLNIITWGEYLGQLLNLKLAPKQNIITPGDEKNYNLHYLKPATYFYVEQNMFRIM